MPTPLDNHWALPPERAKTRAELRTLGQSVPRPAHEQSTTEQPATTRTMRIGEVADRIGLSLRSIRYYEESGLVEPSARTPGGFRLYTEPDVNRLLLIMQMKPLGFSLEEMGEVLGAIDALDDDTADADLAHARNELAHVLRDVEERLAVLRGQVDIAETFRSYLAGELDALDASSGVPTETGTTRLMRTASTRRPSMDSTVNE